MPTVIGIDQSLTNTGIAVLTRGDRIPFLHSVKSEPGQPIETRVMAIVREINRIVGTATGFPDVNPALVVLEGISAGSFGATTSILELGFLHYLIRTQLTSQRIPFKVCAPTSLKKFCCGTGGSPKDPVTKQRVMKDLLKNYGVDTNDDNQADAAVLAFVAAGAAGWIEPRNEAQREVLAKLAAGPTKKPRKIRQRQEGV